MRSSSSHAFDLFAGRDGHPAVDADRGGFDQEPGCAFGASDLHKRLRHKRESPPFALYGEGAAADKLTVRRRAIARQIAARPAIVPNVHPGGKGNRALGIPAGQKQRGVTVEVIRGQRNAGFVPGGFLLPLRRGNQDGGNGFGVFARTKGGQLRHRYGPSVYQLFAYQADRILADVADDLENTLVEQVDAALQKALES